MRFFLTILSFYFQFSAFSQKDSSTNFYLNYNYSLKCNDVTKEANDFIKNEMFLESNGNAVIDIRFNFYKPHLGGGSFYRLQFFNYSNDTINLNFNLFQTGLVINFGKKISDRFTVNYSQLIGISGLYRKIIFQKDFNTVLESYKENKGNTFVEISVPSFCFTPEIGVSFLLSKKNNFLNDSWLTTTLNYNLISSKKLGDINGGRVLPNLWSWNFGLIMPFKKKKSK